MKLYSYDCGWQGVLVCVTKSKEEAIAATIEKLKKGGSDVLRRSIHTYREYCQSA